ncbi:MAG: DUF1501 domain-containing protein [Bryobacterales bacterium]|nr:DUF1501 domain-containing protein [Bryobacterales bacterium]
MTSRRELLKRVSIGFPSLAFSSLAASPTPHARAKAKNVLFLFMPGGVSHMDTFDPKPKLNEISGQLSGQGKRKWHGCPWKFRQYGRAGVSISEIFPHITEVVDELAVVRSMVSSFPLHARGNVFLHTGRNVGGFPSLGSWVTYGLGSENRNLPGYVLLRDEYVPPGGLENFSNGFLPATHQATHLKGDDPPIDNIVPADANALQQAKLDAILAQDRSFAKSTGDDAVESAIRNYEMAYRMQSLVPDVLYLGKESEATKKLYGLDSPDKYKRLYGLQCLRARRLLEAGVRFVEVTSPNIFGMNGTWDQHDQLKKGHETNAFVTDQAVTALIKDLRSRGLLDETLVLWAGEFGRTPDTSNGDGRDHHPACFTIWLAGAGVNRGSIFGSTDELGNKVAENPVAIHDLHATMLHLLGLDHRRLTYRFGSRDVSLTDVHGRVVRELLA